MFLIALIFAHILRRLCRVKSKALLCKTNHYLEKCYIFAIYNQDNISKIINVMSTGYQISENE